MPTRAELLQHLDELLQPNKFQDYCPNGLQIAGREEVRHIVTGVTACQALIDAACERGADTLLVHHGYFWKGEDARLVGIKHQRVKTLLNQDINLLAYHLPLDAHPELGNNAQLAKLLGLNIEGSLATDPSQLVLQGTLPVMMTAAELSLLLEQKLARAPLHIGAAKAKVSRVAWCTGAAQNYLQLAVDAGVDAFITGEINEPAVHLAREAGIQFYSAGHHATERYGVKALGEHLAQHFGVAVEFIDIDNPV